MGFEVAIFTIKGLDNLDSMRISNYIRQKQEIETR